MSSTVQPGKEGVASFRTKLFTAMMIIVATLTALGLYFAQRKIMADAGRDLRQNFQGELSSLHDVEELRQAALAEHCRLLAAKPRIHAALEDNALDLLYPSAKNELRDLMEGEEPAPEQAAHSLHAKFYRFLNENGAVLSPPNPKEVGELRGDAEAQLALKKLPQMQQIRYLPENADGPEAAVDEIMVVPIFSTDTGSVISALVVGFKPFELALKRAGAAMISGIWVNGRVYLLFLPASAEAALGAEISDAIAKSDRAQSNFTVYVNGAPQLLFYRRLDPNSLFAPAYEICIYPLADSIARQHRLRWQIGGAGVLLLLGGFVASHFTAMRLSVPVEKL